MPRVYRRGKRWYIDYTNAAGNRIRRSAGYYRWQAEQILKDITEKEPRHKFGLPEKARIKSIKLSGFNKIYL